jgi:hypothetical protein
LKVEAEMRAARWWSINQDQLLNSNGYGMRRQDYQRIT